ncbi:MAG: ABC transporter substrate-binding protein [Acetobacteraceae bacterium]|nr:ABC transporter substrate-binding protein [Acetobacteraceae bacterium]
MRKLLLNTALAAGALLALASLPAAAQPAAGNLRIGLAEDPDLLDPTLGSSYVGRVVYAAMCDKLFDLDEKLNIVPQLATGYRYESPTSLVITLRPGVTFHDGEKLDAEAAKYKLTRDLTMKGSMRAGEINAIQAIDVIDPLTIRLTLKQPASQLLAQLTDRAGIMISPKAAEAAGDKFGLAPVCAGPFAFESRVAQDRIVLKRFPAHYDAGNYHFERVTYLPIPNSPVRLANLKAGSLDLAAVAPSDVPAVRDDPKLVLAMWDALGYVGINFNVANGPAANTPIGQNALIRRAFERAIDRKALIDVVFGGLFTPTAQANPPSSPFYVPEIQPPARDIAKARALLAQAGVTGRVAVELTVTNSPEAQQAAEVIQSMVAEAGFDLKPKVMEFASSLQAGYKGEFQAYMIGWSGRSDADGNMWAQMHSKGTFNYGRHSNPAMDQLLDDARVATSVADRRAIYAKVWEIQRQDLPLIYLYSGKNIMGMQKYLAGLKQVPDGLIRLGGVRFTP